MSVRAARVANGEASNDADHPATPRGRRVRLPTLRVLDDRWGTASWVFTVLALVFGAFFAVITPPFWGHDEITQFGRAYQIAHGGLLPTEIEDERGTAYGGGIPVSVDALMDYAQDDYTHNPDEPAPLAQNPSGYDRLEDAPVTDAETTMWFSNTAGYSAVPYLPAAVGIRAAQALGLDVGGMLLASRLAGLAAYLALAGFGLHVLRGRRVQWLAFTVALLPIVVFQAGTVTADTMTNALAIMVSALLMKGLFLGDRLRRVETGALLASALALPLCKPTYVLLAMAVLVIPADRTGLSGWRRWLPWAFAGTGLVLFLVWNRISAPTTEGAGLMRRPEQWHSVRPGEQLSGILHDPVHFVSVFAQSVMRRDLEWFTGFFGELGFAYVDVPATSIVACLVALAMSLGIAERMVASHRRTAIVAAAVTASIALVFVTLYLAFSPVGYFIIDGVQGRYFVPLAIAAFAVLLRWIPLRLASTDGSVPVRGAAITIIAATVLALAAASLQYYLVVWG